MFHESNLKHSRIIAKLKQSPLCLPSSESVTKGSDILIAYSRGIAVIFYFFSLSFRSLIFNNNLQNASYSFYSKAQRDSIF